MRMKLHVGKVDDIVNYVEELSGENITKCYQCGECSAGCPSVGAMDLLPNQVIRYVQLGQIDEVLKCKTIWICASCLTCTVRCPRGINLASVMESLRQILLRKGKNHVEPYTLDKGMIEALPQIALVSNFRKTTS